MDKVAHTYGQVQRNVHRTLKKALDPNGILAPGKSGIRIADNVSRLMTEWGLAKSVILARQFGIAFAGH